jgi:hypothetical protein
MKAPLPLCPSRCTALCALLLAWFAATSPTSAATISWWRFENGADSDPSPAGLINANEVPGEPAMVSSNAIIVTDAPSLFAPYIPLNGIPNTGSVRSFTNGNSNDGIFGTAAYSPTLDTYSLTVEFWIRTTENEAGFVARTTNPAESGESGNLSNGFRIVEPQNLRVEYWVSQINGNNPTLVTLTSGIAINDGNWHYVAFRYNHTNGVGDLILDGNVVATNDGPNNRRLWYGPNGSQPAVHIGYRLDGAPNNTIGTLDEIRFSDLYLPNEQLLVVPEPSTIAAGLLLLAWIAFDARRRWIRSQV